MPEGRMREEVSMVNLVAEAEGLVVRQSFPHRIRVIDHQWIPLSDGVRLAARIWLPHDAERNPVPAIIEYIPYRHRDFTLPRDEMIHPWFAGHGYAAIRLDIRGSGNSEGLPMDEYVAREQDDMLEALAWIAAQDWCTGTVRHDRHLLGRLQRPADGVPRAIRTRRHHHAVLDG